MGESGEKAVMRSGEKPRAKSAPGGTIAHRDLHFYWLVDISGSMDGEKINALNNAIRDTLPSMKSAANGNLNTQMKVSVVAFHDIAERFSENVPIQSFEWKDLEAGGETAMGKGLEMVIDDFGKLVDNKAKLIPPVIVLVTDGMPTDEDRFKDQVARLEQLPWGKKAVRIALSFRGVGECDEELLKSFADQHDHVILVAKDPAYLTELIRWVSTTVAQSTSSAPATKIDTGTSPHASPIIPPPVSPASDADIFGKEWGDEEW